jgi:hypothetical protein
LRQKKGGSLPLLLLPLRRTILRMRFRSRGIDVVVHVDANVPSNDLRNARINRLGRRIQPCRPEPGILAAKDRDDCFSSQRSY